MKGSYLFKKSLIIHEVSSQKAPLDILKFSLIASPRRRKHQNFTDMFIQFSLLVYSRGHTIKFNFNMHIASGLRGAR